MKVPPEWFEPAIPSRQVALLEQLIGQTVVSMVRFSETQPEQLIKPHPELGHQSPLAPHQLFSLMPGPLALSFDSGLEIAVGADEHCEISLDLRRHPNGEVSDYLFEEDPEYYPLSAADARFCRPEIHQMLGKRVLDVTLLRMDGAHFKKNRSFEMGLVLYVEHCPELVLSGGLTRGLDDFAVTLREEILPENRRYLTEERLVTPQR